MLDDIFKAIDKKADEEIKNIRKQKEEAFLRMENQLRQELKTRKEQEAALLQEKSKKEIEELERKRESEMKFRLQREKQAIVKLAYRKAIEKLQDPADKNEKEFRQIIVQAADILPKKVLGEITADQKTARILKKILGNKIKSDLKEPGFILQSPLFEIDCRFSEMLKQKKEETEPALNKILFE